MILVKPKPISADCAARRVLMSCYLYYSADTNILTDHEYEALVKRVVAGWDYVDPVRQWQMKSRESIAATGHHVKLTTLTIGAAIQWAKDAGAHGRLVWPTKWSYDMARKLRWSSVNF